MTLTVNIPQIIGAVGPIRIHGSDLLINRNGSAQKMVASAGKLRGSGRTMAPFALALLLPFAGGCARRGEARPGAVDPAAGRCGDCGSRTQRMRGDGERLLRSAAANLHADCDWNLEHAARSTNLTLTIG